MHFFKYACKGKTAPAFISHTTLQSTLVDKLVTGFEKVILRFRKNYLYTLSKFPNMLFSFFALSPKQC